MKKHKYAVALSFFVILLPIAVGLLLWKALPDSMTTHWDLSGQADGSMEKVTAIVLLPLIMAVAQAICLLFTKKVIKEQGKKIFFLVIWIIPAITLISQGIILASALRLDIPLAAMTYLPLGLMFILIGNYMPKSKQNRYFGIKIKWTLESEANWNATHRFAGKLWVMGGLLFLPCATLPLSLMPWLITGLVTVLILPPVIYSYRFSKKHPDKDTALAPLSKTAKIISLVFVVLILVGAAVLMFTGSVDYRFEAESFTIEADYWADYTVFYEQIDSIEYRKNFDQGARTYGFGSPKLSLGHYKNEEFKDYLSYIHTGCGDAILLTAEGGTIVFNSKTEAETKALYETILSHLP